MVHGYRDKQAEKNIWDSQALAKAQVILVPWLLFSIIIINQANWPYRPFKLSQAMWQGANLPRWVGRCSFISLNTPKAFFSPKSTYNPTVWCLQKSPFSYLARYLFEESDWITNRIKRKTLFMQATRQELVLKIIFIHFESERLWTDNVLFRHYNCLCERMAGMPWWGRSSNIKPSTEDTIIICTM